MSNRKKNPTMSCHDGVGSYDWIALFSNVWEANHMFRLYRSCPQVSRGKTKRNGCNGRERERKHAFGNEFMKKLSNIGYQTSMNESDDMTCVSMESWTFLHSNWRGIQQQNLAERKGGESEGNLFFGENQNEYDELGHGIEVDPQPFILLPPREIFRALKARVRLAHRFHATLECIHHAHAIHPIQNKFLKNIIKLS